MKNSTYRVIMALAFLLLAARHFAQTTGDIATFKKASGPGDVKTYTTPVNSSLFSLNSSGNFSLLPQSTFQPALVSGTNLRTVQGTSLLGSGNIAIIADEINNGVTNAGPSQNAVFDALAGKAAASHTHVSADITDASAGGNGLADAGKVAIYGTEGQLRGTAVDANAAVYGSSEGNAYGGYFTSASSLWPAVYINGSGSQAALQVDRSGGGVGLDVSSTNKAARFHALSFGSGTPDIADFVTGVAETTKLTVKFDGGLEWGSTGAQTTATNLPTFGTSTKGVVPASGGGTSNFLRADGTWAAPSGGGGGVASFNGRTGTVTATLGDYDASQVNNDSNVPGGSVAEALDQLDADKLEDGAVLSTGVVFPSANGVRIRDAGNDHTLGLRVGGNLPADWTLNLLPNADARTLTIADNATVSGTNTGDQTITLTGDVTGSGTGSFSATIANDAVTYAKLQNVSATDRILGRSSSGAGDVEEITCTSAGRALLDDADAAAQRATLGQLPELMTGFTGGTQSTTLTTLSDVTNSTFSLDANTWYELEWNFVYSAAATTTGAFFSINSAGSADYVSAVVYYDCGSGDGDNKVYNAFNQGTAMASSRATSNNRGTIRAIIKTSAAIDVVMRFATEVNGSAITMNEMKGWKKRM